MTAVAAFFLVVWFSALAFSVDQQVRKHNQMVNQALNHAQGIERVEHRSGLPPWEE